MRSAATVCLLALALGAAVASSSQTALSDEVLARGTAVAAEALGVSIQSVQRFAEEDGFEEGSIAFLVEAEGEMPRIVDIDSKTGNLLGWRPRSYLGLFEGGAVTLTASDAVRAASDLAARMLPADVGEMTWEYSLLEVPGEEPTLATVSGTSVARVSGVGTPRASVLVTLARSGGQVIQYQQYVRPTTVPGDLLTEAEAWAAVVAKYPEMKLARDGRLVMVRDRAMWDFLVTGPEGHCLPYLVDASTGQVFASTIIGATEEGEAGFSPSPVGDPERTRASSPLGGFPGRTGAVAGATVLAVLALALVLWRRRR